MKTFAGIGSRETPPYVLDRMRAIAGRLGASGWRCRTGGADGADTAFEEAYGAFPYQLELYLPWKGFNGSRWGFLPSVPAFEMARKYHPNWGGLSWGATKLMARNCHQVLGPMLNDPVDFIICWTKDGKASGGTGQALRIAEDLKIRVYNLYNHDSQLDEQIGEGK